MNYYKCDAFKKISKDELKNIFDKLLEINLDVRSELDMDKSVKFGTEIEFMAPYKNEFIIKDKYGFKKRKLFNSSKDFSKWTIKNEQACYGGEYGSAPLELVTPIMNSSKDNLKNLSDTFKYLTDNNCTINMFCGNHIHYDCDILKNKNKYYDRFLKFFTIYEPIIYLFSCGEYDNVRNKMNTYFKEIGYNFKVYRKNNKVYMNKIKNMYDSKENIIRFTDFHTIELRSPMGTLNPVINQNYILFFYKIFEYVTSKNYDSELIDTKFDTTNRGRILNSMYDYIKIEDILDLTDMLYSNNLDKLYFIKQCLKLYNDNDYKYANHDNLYEKDNYKNIKRLINNM